MPYRATHIEKIITKDHKDSGCELESKCVIDERIEIEADTIERLLKAIQECYGYDDKYWYIPEEGGWVEFNRHENDTADPLTHEECLKLWEQGKNVWLCDYSFKVEVYESRGLTEEEIRGAIEASGKYTCD